LGALHVDERCPLSVAAFRPHDLSAEHYCREFRLEVAMIVKEAIGRVLPESPSEQRPRRFVLGGEDESNLVSGAVFGEQQLVIREVLDTYDRDGLACVPKFWFGELIRCRPGGQDARGGISLLQFSGGVLMDANEVRVIEIVFRGETVRRIHIPADDEGQCHKSRQPGPVPDAAVKR
jgi:hypothetical protein